VLVVIEGDGSVVLHAGPTRTAVPCPLCGNLVARRSVRELDDWLEDASASGLPPFVSLVRGIRTDRTAVNAGLTLPWSTGPVEGHVTRVNLIKRSGYGRQSTQLLRRRDVSSA
jgi:transposase